MPAEAGAAYPPPGTGWADIPVPAEWNMTAGLFGTDWDAYDLFGTPADWDDVDTAWYRRTLAVPARLKGQRIVLRFEAVSFEATVYCGGVRVAHHAEGLLPFEADITDHVAFGGDTVVHLLVASPVSGSKQSDGFHHPCGSWWGQLCAGIWQDAWLLARDPVSVADTAVTTSVAKGTFTAATTLRNDGPKAATVTVDHTVWDGARQVKKVSGRVFVPGGGTAELRAAANWPDARLWNPADPHLYELRVDVRADAGSPVLDTSVTRFGFREVTVSGPRILLNGEPVVLRGDAWHYMGSIENSRAYATLWMTMAMRAGVNYMRLHAMPYPPVFYDIADELGMLLIGESGIYGSSGNYAMGADDFWANCATHLTARTVRDRNHPSVIAWSAENEMLAAFGQSYAHRVAALKPVVLAQDATRPVYFEGDQDPEGAGDFKSTHYPLEMTTKNTAVPESGRVFAVGGSSESEWDRQKPFLIGEFSAMYYADPSDVSALGGPAAYADLEGFWSAHALAVRAQIEGFRYAGITGVSPWNTVWYGMRPLPFDGTSVPKPDPSGSGPRLERVGRWAATLNPGFATGLPAYTPNPIHDAVARAFRPLGAYALDYRTHYWSATTLSKKVAVYNDDAADAKVTVSWSLDVPGAGSRSGSASPTVPGAGKAELTAALALPKVAQATDAAWQISVRRAGRTVFTDTATLTLYPKPAATSGVPGGLRAAVLEAPGSTATTDALTALGVSARVLTDLGTLPDPAAEVLVLAEGGNHTADADEQKRVTAFAEAGGRVLVLAQDHVPQVLPWPLFTTGTPATVTHVCAPHHPVLAGLRAHDLRWWQTDQEVVVSTLLLKPRLGSLLSLADAGPGLGGSALAEARYGKGAYLLCQYPVIAARGAEPVADLLLRGILRHLATPPAATGRVAVLADDADAKGTPGKVVATLRAASLDPKRLTALDDGALDDVDVLLVDAGAPGGPALDSFAARTALVRAWVAAGGTLWINGATAATLPKAAALLPPGTALAALDADHQHGAVTTGDSPLTGGISNADLEWPAAGPALVTAALQVRGGRAALTTRPVSWGYFKAGTEQTKYGRAEESARGHTPAPVVWETTSGKGRIVVDQLLWATGTALPAQAGLAALLAAALGGGFTAGAGSGELPTDGWKGFTNPATGDPASGYDRDPGTRWSSDALQQAGFFYGLDLGATHTLSRIVWDTSTSPGDIPSGLDVQVSLDNTAYTTALSLADTSPYASGGVLTLTLDPVAARYFKVVVTKPAGTYLSVHELYVYESAGTAD
ncbi:discoidin domain-containing protein [Streptomyces sp. 8L]|nr:discoidin domain-containing protein [Streptomyces sp. 8L]